MIWRENLEALKIKVGASNKSIGDGIGRSERTIARVFSKRFEDHKRGHSLDLIQDIVDFLGGKMSDIFDDATVRIVDRSYLELQEKLDAVIAERDDLTAENKSLKEAVQAKEVELLTLKLRYTEELLDIHKHYNKINPQK